MSFKLWNFFDTIDIENLIIKHNLNKIKIVLYPLDDGYEIFMKINGKDESMYFTYEDTRVLDSLDYGLLPTTILSGICQAKEQYLYSNYVIVEVCDRRYSNVLSNAMDPVSERKYLTVLRITDNSIIKLTGIKSRLGDLREEQQWISRNTSRLNNLDFNIDYSDSEDGYAFMNSDWFQTLVHKKHISRVLHKKQKSHWNPNIDGKFHPDLLHNIQHTRLKKHVTANLRTSARRTSEDVDESHCKTVPSDDMMEKISKLLESQKQNILKSYAVTTVPKITECHEECFHKMIIRSPMSGSNFKLMLSRCPLHNRHWGHLIVDQWEGSSTKPIRFELPGGFNQGRRLLLQLSEMVGAKMSGNVDSSHGNITESGISDHIISPKLVENASNSKSNPSDTIWESIESIMTKNIQSGKPLYDNRDNTGSSVSMLTADVDRKKKSINKNKVKQSLGSADLGLQMPSKNNALLKAAGLNGEQQQKQSFYSLKDLNLDDLF